MASTVLHASAELLVLDYRCEAGPGDAPFSEQYRRYSVSFVRKGSFGLDYRGRRHDLVAGSLQIGRLGDDYCCRHGPHQCGDECLSFQLSEACAESLGISADAWRIGTVPPHAQTAVFGQLGQAAADGLTDIGLQEAGLMLAGAFARLTSTGRGEGPATATADDERKRAVRAALWIAAHAHTDIDLDRAAAEVHLSPFHFLRLFRRALGVTPHQYLIRSRLGHAARLLADGAAVTEAAYASGFQDLSNFIRTFRGAAGVPPKAFQSLARDQRKILQDRIALPRA